jgi:hypothetical protein
MRNFREEFNLKITSDSFHLESWIRITAEIQIAAICHRNRVQSERNRSKVWYFVRLGSPPHTLRATRYVLEGSGIESQLEGREFLHPSRPDLGPSNLSFPGVKRPGRGINHPLPCSTEVKERVDLLLWVFMACYRVKFASLVKFVKFVRYDGRNFASSSCS